MGDCKMRIKRNPGMSFELGEQVMATQTGQRRADDRVAYLHNATCPRR